MGPDQSAYFEEPRLKPPSVRALLISLVPFIATCFSVSFWDRLDPIVLGLPFNFFWLILWLLLTPLCMLGAYRLETRCSRGVRREEGDAS
jgi:hypothetical protein